jgi:hypothetical protein
MRKGEVVSNSADVEDVKEVTVACALMLVASTRVGKSVTSINRSEVADVVDMGMADGCCWGNIKPDTPCTAAKAKQSR